MAVRVSPEPAGVELLKTYRTALNHALNRILSLNLRTSGTFIELHRESL